MDQIVAEFVASYLTDRGTVNPWFTRRLKEQPAIVQKAVKQELREQGLLNDWLTGDDWVRLTELVIADLDPKKDLVQRCNELLVEIHPEPKKRVTARNIHPMIDHIHGMWIEYKQLKNQPTREQLLAEIGAEELMVEIGRRLAR